MALSIELPPPLEEELAIEAERKGVTASEQATLLLLLATALTGEGRDSPFRRAVRGLLERNSLDADRLARSLQALLRSWRNPEVDRTIEGNHEIEMLPRERPLQATEKPTAHSIMGKYAHLGGGTEEFMREKQREIDREDRR